MSAASTSMGYSVFSDKDLDSCLQQDTSEKNDLKLFKQGILREDAIELSLQMMNSQGPGYYQLDNQYGCECSLKEAREIQTSQPGISFKGGCGCKSTEVSEGFPWCQNRRLHLGREGRG